MLKLELGFDMHHDIVAFAKGKFRSHLPDLTSSIDLLVDLGVDFLKNSFGRNNNFLIYMLPQKTSNNFINRDGNFERSESFTNSQGNS